MGILLDWGKSVIKEVEHGLLEEASGKLEGVCKRVTQDIREDIVHSWFSELNYGSLDAATQYDPSMEFGENRLTAIVNSYVDSGAYNPASMRLDQWNAYHGFGGDPRVQILQMQMHSAFIGLPKFSTVSNWVNKDEHFHPRSQGLEAETNTNGKWKEFEGRVKGLL